MAGNRKDMRQKFCQGERKGMENQVKAKGKSSSMNQSSEQKKPL